MRTKNTLFGIFLAALAILGATLGYQLSEIPRLVPYKLLNIAGIIYGIVGVVVLSEMVTTRDSLKKFMVNWVAGVLIWAHNIVPLGALIGAFIGHTMPSSGVTARFFLSFLTYSIVVSSIVGEVVFFPKMVRFRSLESRTQAFGLILILSGLFVQLIAAVQDFNG